MELFPGTLIMGIPGSGKSTLGRAMAAERNGYYYSASAVLDNYSKQDPDMVERWRRIWAIGQMAPDAEVLPVLWNYYAAMAGRGPVFLDGYPRTITQLEDFHNNGGAMELVLLLEIDDSAAANRIAERRVSIGRTDDDWAVSRGRIERARQDIGVLRRASRVAGCLVSLDCSQLTPGAVASRALEIYDRRNARARPGGAAR